MQHVLDFLNQLKENNHREWFEDNKNLYQTAKQTVEDLTQKIIEKLAPINPEVASLKAKDCMFRINRDVRFSKDKSPYKTNMGAYIAKGGKKSLLAGYYLHLEPQECFLGGGSYMPMPEYLNKIRQEIDYNPEEFINLTQAPDFVKYFGEIEGEKLKTAPKGYPKDHIALDYLKHKSFIAQHKISDAQTSETDFVNYCVHIFSFLTPFNQFLNRAFE